MSLLRFITCGSVDAGKNSLISRLLHDAALLFGDQLAAEREQGITIGVTIDAAYRHFSTDKRKFIVADTPGREQFTRNMATGASTADVAVLLVDAREGLLTQTRRQAHLVAMLGVRQVVLGVNKMDLVGFDAKVFQRIAHDWRALAASLGLDQVVSIPLCALHGDHVVSPRSRMPWHDGPPLLAWLETCPLDPTPPPGGALAPAGAVGQPAQHRIA